MSYFRGVLKDLKLGAEAEKRKLKLLKCDECSGIGDAEDFVEIPESKDVLIICRVCAREVL